MFVVLAKDINHRLDFAMVFDFPGALFFFDPITGGRKNAN
jgi:hypothetical protein